MAPINYEGMVICRIKGFYQLETVDFGPLLCKVKGNLFESSRYDNQIAVGDQVLFTKEQQDDVGLIHTIKPKKSILSRSRVEKSAEQILAANIDTMFIVASIKSPPFRHNLVLRLLIAAISGDIQPIIVVTKTDLTSSHKVEDVITPYKTSGIQVFTFSTHNENNPTELKTIFNSGLTVLAGHSGVGKSSLINYYYPDLNIKIGGLSKKRGRGAHTTTYAQAHKISDQSYVIDTPGIREFGLWQVTQENLADYFPFFDKLEQPCMHRNCRHLSEPGCSIKAAVETGEINPIFYNGYCSIYEDLPKK